MTRPRPSRPRASRPRLSVARVESPLAKLPLALSIRATTGQSLVPYLRKHLLAAHAMLSPRLEELSVAIVGDATMGRLHEQFMNIPGPTDVLTFPLDVDRHGRPVGGEVIVCLPEARRNARQHGVHPRAELLLYAVHGMLHLCGFDDTTRRAFERMHRMEDHLLTSLGVGAVFRRQTLPTADVDAAVSVKGRGQDALVSGRGVR